MATKIEVMVRRHGKDFEVCAAPEGYLPTCHYGRSAHATAAGVVKWVVDSIGREAKSLRAADPFAGYSKKHRRTRRVARKARRS